jgi:two-component system LytT family response regulator
MRTIIIDDEESARERLRRMLRVHPEITVIGEARDGLEAVQTIEESRPELIFLDIEMPGLTGFQVLRSLPRAVIPLVIFATGYDQHALAAFDANALAYLLKPVEAERLAWAVDRAQKLAASGSGKEREHILDVVRGTPGTLRQIVCHKRDRMFLIQPEQVLWFQVEDGIVKAHTATDTYWVNYPLGELEASLPDEMFFRARREVLVNLATVKEIRPYFKSGFLLIMNDAAATGIAVSERQSRPLRLRIPGL